MTAQDQYDLVLQSVMQLGEHFESVQILASNTEGGETRFIFEGGGNVFARRGMATAWLEDLGATNTADRLAENITDPPDDSEAWKN
jgi:hypothetical protein